MSPAPCPPPVPPRRHEEPPPATFSWAFVPLIHDVFAMVVPANNGDHVRRLVGPHLWDQLVEGYREDFSTSRHRSSVSCVAYFLKKWITIFRSNCCFGMVFKTMMDIGESDVDKDQLLNLLLEALTGKTSADLRRFLATLDRH
jgi:hypothetical protein